MRTNGELLDGAASAAATAVAVSSPADAPPIPSGDAAAQPATIAIARTDHGRTAPRARRLSLSHVSSFGSPRRVVSLIVSLPIFLQRCEACGRAATVDSTARHEHPSALRVDSPGKPTAPDRAIATTVGTSQVCSIANYFVTARTIRAASAVREK